MVGNISEIKQKMQAGTDFEIFQDLADFRLFLRYNVYSDLEYDLIDTIRDKLGVQKISTDENYSYSVQFMNHTGNLFLVYNSLSSAILGLLSANKELIVNKIHNMFNYVDNDKTVKLLDMLNCIIDGSIPCANLYDTRLINHTSMRIYL